MEKALPIFFFFFFGGGVLTLCQKMIKRDKNYIPVDFLQTKINIDLKQKVLFNSYM